MAITGSLRGPPTTTGDACRSDLEEGDEVEVCSKQVGFVGSYYAATVITNIGNPLLCRALQEPSL